MSSFILQRYVARQVMLGVAITLSVILVMIFLVDFVELSRDLGDRPDVSPIRVAGLSLLRAPALGESTLPFVFLFGAMWAMYRLNRRSELVVMRAAGMSAWRFIAPAVVLAFVTGILMITALSPAAAELMAQFERQRALIVNGDRTGITLNEQQLWLREGRADGQIVIRARSSDAGASLLRNVTMFRYEIDEQGLPEFVNRLEVDEAELRAGFWQLRDVREFAPDAPTIVHERLAIPTDIDPTSLVDTDSAPRTLTIWELPRQIKLLQENGFESIQYELRWHRLLALPTTLAAMALVASAACLRLTRRGGAFQLALLAAVVGFAMYFGDEMLAALGATELLPLQLAAWTAPLFTCFAALFVISTLEEG